MFLDTRPQVTRCCNPGSQVPKRERSRLNTAAANLVPRTRRGYRRTSPRPNRIHCRKRRAVAITACVDQNATSPIHFAELLRQQRRMPTNQYAADFVSKAFHLTEIGRSIQRHDYMKAFG